MTDIKHESKQIASHTPGPWHVRRWAGADVAIFADDVHLANCYLEENGVANGCLIAAAPRLLEALELVAPEVWAYCCNLHPKERWKYERLEAAIAEAKGLAV